MYISCVRVVRSATTHTDLLLRAESQSIRVEVIHNASIMNAVGCCGLQLYQFGQTVVKRCLLKDVYNVYNLLYITLNYSTIIVDPILSRQVAANVVL